jgi:hypothetical protein
MLYREYITQIEKIQLTHKHRYEKFRSDFQTQHLQENVYITDETHRLEQKKAHQELDLRVILKREYLSS